MPTAIVEPDGCGRHGDGVRSERALVLDVEMSNCAKEEVSPISSWRQIQIRSEKSQTKFKIKKGALRVNYEKRASIRALFFTCYLLW
jgi:hypothetical protein